MIETTEDRLGLCPERPAPDSISNGQLADFFNAIDAEQKLDLMPGAKLTP